MRERELTIALYCVLQEIHPRLQRHVKHRLQAIESGKGLDWATAEVRNLSLSTDWDDKIVPLLMDNLT